MYKFLKEKETMVAMNNCVKNYERILLNIASIANDTLNWGDGSNNYIAYIKCLDDYVIFDKKVNEILADTASYYNFVLRLKLNGWEEVKAEREKWVMQLTFMKDSLARTFKQFAKNIDKDTQFYVVWDSDFKINEQLVSKLNDSLNNDQPNI